MVWIRSRIGSGFSKSPDSEKYLGSRSGVIEYGSETLQVGDTKEGRYPVMITGRVSDPYPDPHGSALI